MDNQQKQVIFEPIVGHQFGFRCHRDIPCFTKCCADLNLILTPYDIVRIKNRLGMSSDAFLEQYTDTRMEEHTRFPLIKLNMNRDKSRRCPFVTREGCSIYEDRPGSCRIYPLGRASLKVDREKETREKFFIVNEGHCLGFEEGKQWTTEEWMADQGVDEYNAMNDQWLAIITSPKSLGQEKDIPRKIQMFYMASYDLDKFRRFIFESRFFDLFQGDAEKKEKLACDDVELMKFAFDWLNFSLFGEKTIQVKSETIAHETT
ncbi:MAG: YkgJ family cysteine cluster protein [Desulfatiglandales bacterium]